MSGRVTGVRDWFVPLTGDSGTRLFAFPHAGAGCAQLAGFARSCSELGVTVWSANLPGRQARLQEQARTDYAEVVDELATALAARIEQRPYTLFGYCGGALLGYGVAKELLARGAPPPERLLVVSYEAPDIAQRPHRLPGLPADLLWSYLRESGGVPASLSGDPRLRKVAEGAIRADFALLAGYRHQPSAPLPLPITVFFGTRDEQTPRGALLGWRRHSTRPVELRGVDSGHWPLDDACAELAREVANVMSGGSDD